ncbi:MAG: T9SS type A sorting domain-containing protein [Bacteroidota bacterium]
MKKFTLSLKFAFCLLSLSLININKADAQNCDQALPFTTGNTYTFPAATNVPTQTNLGIDYGCLMTAPNPVWYYAKIDQPGDLIIFITSDAGEDIDFITWGPFPTLDSVCNMLTGNGGPYPNNDEGMTNDTLPNPAYPAGKITDCSYSPRSNEFLHIMNAQAGDFYMICITNFSNANHNITFNQVNSASGIAGLSFGTLLTSIVDAGTCSMQSLNAAPEQCNAVTNTHTVIGTLEFLNAPPTGTLTVKSGNSSQVFNAPFSSPIQYQLTGNVSDGLSHLVTASFSDAMPVINSNYTSPQPCNANSINENNNLSNYICAPNPASNNVNISSSSNNIIESIEVYDIYGRQVLKLEQLNKSTYQLDISSLNRGKYIVNIKDAKQINRLYFDKVE